MSKKVIISALGALIAMGIGTQAMADDTDTAKATSQKMKKGLEKCYGIAKAGKNDCGTGEQSCSGTSKTDREATAWIALPKGTCDKIVGGSTSEPKTSE